MEIPEDIRTVARFLALEWADILLEEKCEEAIARAILAERERCAEIAKSTKKVERMVGGIYSYGGPDWYTEIVPVWEDGEDIAAAIRTPSTGEET